MHGAEDSESKTSAENLATPAGKPVASEAASQVARNSSSDQHAQVESGGNGVAMTAMEVKVCP